MFSQSKEELLFAKKYLDKIINEENNGTPDLIKERGKVNYLLGYLELAVKDFENYLLTSENDTDILYNLGSIYLEKKEYDYALVYFKNCIKNAPQNKGALFGVSYIYMEYGEYSRAKGILFKLASRYPQDHEIINNLALCYKELGNLEESVRLFDNVLSICKEKANYYYNRGSVFLLKGDLDKAEDDFLSALGISSKNNYALGYMTILKIKQKKINEACSYFSQITEDVFDLKSYSEIKQCK